MKQTQVKSIIPLFVTLSLVGVIGIAMGFYTAQGNKGDLQRSFAGTCTTEFVVPEDEVTPPVKKKQQETVSQTPAATPTPTPTSETNSQTPNKDFGKNNILLTVTPTPHTTSTPIPTPTRTPYNGDYYHSTSGQGAGQ